jgi:hypothetical protein
MGTTANQKKLFFNLRKAKGRISALDEGDLRPDQVVAGEYALLRRAVVDEPVLPLALALLAQGRVEGGGGRS